MLKVDEKLRTTVQVVQPWIMMAMTMTGMQLKYICTQIRGMMKWKQKLNA